MASSQPVLLSPAELAYLHASLSLAPPLRPDGRAAGQFRPLSAETDILPGTNGSARICFADGTEAIVGVKAEIEKTRVRYGAGNTLREAELVEAGGGGGDDDDGETDGSKRVEGESGWVEIAVEIPGTRDDDAGTIYLAEMLAEALLADGEFVKRLWINRRFHWKLYLDVGDICCVHRADDAWATNMEKNTDSTHLATTLIPPSSIVPHHTPCASCDSTATAEI